MAVDWRSILELAPFAVGALRPDSPMAQGVMQGFLESQERMRRERRLDAHDALLRQQFGRQQAATEAQIRNQDRDNARAEQLLRLNRLQALMETIPGLDVAPTETELTALAQGFEVAPEVAQPLMPPLLSRGKRRRAGQAWERFVKERKSLGAEEPDILVDAQNTSYGEGEFQGMTPSDVRGLFESLPLPSVAVRKKTGTFAEYLNANPAERAEIEAARKGYQQADDRPMQPATVVIQTVDAEGRPVSRIVPKTPGAVYAAPPTTAGRAQLAENEAATAGLTRIVALAPDVDTLARWVGPVQGRANEVRIATPGFDVDPEMAEFFAEVAALKNRMIRAITGAQMSEPEAKRIMAQLPNIRLKPGVFLARVRATERNLRELNARIAAQSGVTMGPPVPPPAPLVKGHAVRDPVTGKLVPERR